MGYDGRDKFITKNRDTEMQIDVTRYKGLIFDMDGTLIDTMPAHIHAWGMAAKEFDFPFEPEWINAHGGMPSSKIVHEMNQKYGLNLEPQQVADYKMQCFAQMSEKGDLIAHTYAVFKQAIGQKKMAIGTGSQKVTALELLEQHQVLSFFDAVVTANDVKAHKPNPDTFLLASKKMGLTPAECVVFEDTELGKQAAHAAGMDCVMVDAQGFTWHPLP